MNYKIVVCPICKKKVQEPNVENHKKNHALEQAKK